MIPSTPTAPLVIRARREPCLSPARPLYVEPIASEAVKPLSTRSEEYELGIPVDRSTATLTANSTLGLYRGLTTFNQPFYYCDGVTYILLAPIAITDAPVYDLRWNRLDTSRNYYRVTDILRTLDAMSWVKRITDSQILSLEVAQYPQLAMNGAYSAAEVYTESDIQYFVQYAGARGIDVLMEIDTPRHTAIIGATCPDYVTCFDAVPWATYANEPPAGQLRFTLPEVMNFTASLLVGVANTLPLSYISTGGDELNTNCYVNDTLTQMQLNSTNTTPKNTFTQTTHGALMATGNTSVVWECASAATLSKTKIIQDIEYIANWHVHIISKGHVQCWFEISIKVRDSQNTMLYDVLQLLGRKASSA
ncbi:hypothetical protein AZE42_10643 [Rhizopogon vesiculosus]|uniref:beta-N-acetylhexosaminidase n=1 Tax=Rhizopogon vesiculosus TaxID=180088 RepID=A0A1J8PNP1_9AGAM|nr:hypothetical protein AZE42_10643 [Rhizopogon vesiculosus]